MSYEDENKNENIAKFALANDKIREHDEGVEINETLDESELSGVPLDADLTKQPFKVADNGWYQIDRDIMPNGGKQYPEHYKFYIRPADGEEIRHWSTLPDDIKNPMDILTYFNYMLEQCLRIEGGEWSDVKEHDKFWFIFFLHEVSFIETERPLIINATCSYDDCENEFKVKVNRDYLHYQFPDVKYDKYIDTKTGVYQLQTKDFGSIVVSQPTLKTVTALLNYIREAKPAWVKKNQAFLDMVAFLIPPHITPTAKVFESEYVKYRSWDKNKFAFMYNIVNELKVVPRETFKIKCKCGRESDQAFDIEGGIKALFKPISNITDQLL